uniref:Tc1-like transposase DDE domain-containing protein n=1 Tax=Hemiselmis tepida TaxID=464990 RepID=A0A6T6VW12_9CRYP|mmetsp:Transcript_31961/g.81343  ORF Transcript_31961/g.81343 Transcript_31961/m.81343 type:complete len:117 (+) Transcript_31961:554-904(+)
MNTTIIVAHGVEGIIAYWLLPEGGSTRDVFYAFLSIVLLPSLDSSRVVLMDNLKSHRNSDIDALFRSTGHKIVYSCRPPHSDLITNVGDFSKPRPPCSIDRPAPASSGWALGSTSG